MYQSQQLETSAKELGRMFDVLKSSVGVTAKPLTKDTLRTLQEDDALESDERKAINALYRKGKVADKVRKRLADANDQLIEAEVAMDSAKMTYERVILVGKVDEALRTDTENALLETLEDTTLNYKMKRETWQSAKSNVETVEEELKQYSETLALLSFYTKKMKMEGVTKKSLDYPNTLDNEDSEEEIDDGKPIREYGGASIVTLEGEKQYVIPERRKRAFELSPKQALANITAYLYEAPYLERDIIIQVEILIALYGDE